MDSSQRPGVDKEVKRLWVTKISLRCFAAVFCLIVIGCCFGSHYVDFLPLGPAGAAVLWNIAEAITLIVRRRLYKGIHPGACVGVDLVLWLAVGGISAYEILLLVDTGDYSYYTPTVAYIVVVFGFIVTVFHIALFIIACIETHRRNTANVAHAPTPFYPNQPGMYNPNQPAPFDPHQPQPPFNPYQPPPTFNPPKQPGTFIPNPTPTTFPPTSPFQAQPQAQKYYPPPSTTLPTPSPPPPQPPIQQPQPHHPPQWQSTPQARHEMSSTPAFHTAAVPLNHHEMSSTPALYPAAPARMGWGITAAAPLGGGYEMPTASAGPEGVVGAAPGQGGEMYEVGEGIPPQRYEMR